MAKQVKLIKEITQNGVTVPVDTVGTMMGSPWQPEKGEYVDAPNQENGVVKVKFLSPSPVVLSIAIDLVKLYLEDVEVGTASTPTPP